MSAPFAPCQPQVARPRFSPKLPAEAATCVPLMSLPFFVMTLTTPKNAFDPYTAEPGPGTYSMRSTRSMSIRNSVPMGASS